VPNHRGFTPGPGFAFRSGRCRPFWKRGRYPVPLHPRIAIAHGRGRSVAIVYGTLKPRRHGDRDEQ